MPSRTSDCDHTSDPTAKRRKIRKGTLSCWSCKRQKSRCEFLRAGDDACVACNRRGIKCVLQHEPEIVSTGSREDLIARLAQVETQMQVLLQSKAQHSKPSAPLPTSQAHDSTSKYLPNSGGLKLNETKKNAQPQTSKCQALVDAWPNWMERQAVLNIPYKIVKLASLLVNKCVGMMEELDLEHLTHMPLHTVSPVSQAVKALTIAIVLQGVVLQGSRAAHPSQTLFAELMERLVCSASSLVAANHDIIQTVEGIQCLALESMYYNNSGRLRAAWLVMRRAVTAAQLIGIEKISNCPAKALTSSTSQRLDPQHMWLNLVQSDQYLSMMLGLSTGASTLRPIDSVSLAALHPFERLERMHCYAADLILLRSRSPSTFEKEKVDTMLKDAAACMPASWWLPAEGLLLAGFDDGQISSLKDEAFVEVGRVMKHLIHYHLVIQLHIPDFLQPPGTAEDFYSRITAINTSRDLVTRYLTFRNASTQSYWYCRGIDILAFIAGTVICLGHILNQNAATPAGGQFTDACSLGFLAHQRLTDRGLLDSLLDRMRLLTEEGTDKISSKIVSIMQPLLEIEAKATGGVQYQLSFDKGEDSTTAFPMNGVSGGVPESLSIHIPCSGVLRIKPATEASAVVETSGGQASITQSPENRSQMPQNDQPAAIDPASGTLQPAVMLDFRTESRDPHSLHSPFDIDLDDWALQGVDSIFFGNLLHGPSFDFDYTDADL